jgi:hypothetical protein
MFKQDQPFLIGLAWVLTILTPPYLAPHAERLFSATNFLRVVQGVTQLSQFNPGFLNADLNSSLYRNHPKISSLTPKSAYKFWVNPG